MLSLVDVIKNTWDDPSKLNVTKEEIHAADKNTASYLNRLSTEYLAKGNLK